MTPKAFDVFCGLGGFSEGFLAAGYRVFGFDNHRHEYSRQVPVRPGSAIASAVGHVDRYPGQLILQDALMIHGSQLKDAAVIVASPPCQNYSYLAMPWSRSSDPENSKAAKALRKKWETEGPDNRLFDACFRIQREAIAARHLQVCCGPKRPTDIVRSEHSWTDGDRTPLQEPTPDGRLNREGGKLTGQFGREPSEATAMQCNGGCYIPLIVENVRGAVPWVGKKQAQFGSFYLWGDVAQIGNRVVAGRDLADIRAGCGRFGMGVAPESSGQKREGRNFHTWALTGGEVSSPSFHGGDHETRGVGMGRKMNPDGTAHPQGSWFRIADSSQGDRRNVTRRNDSGDDPARSSDCVALAECDEDGMREPGLILSGVGKKSRTGGGWFGDSSTTRKSDPRDVRKQPDGSWQTPDGTTIGGDWFSDPNSTCRKHGSRSNARKARQRHDRENPLRAQPVYRGAAHARGKVGACPITPMNRQKLSPSPSASRPRRKQSRSAVVCGAEKYWEKFW